LPFFSFSFRNKTEQRIHEMAKLESMTDNEFEDQDYPPGSGRPPPGSGGSHLEMEQDPLFDPLSIVDEGSGSAALNPVQTEAFMQNMVNLISKQA
jgi:hypothetical protein